MKCDKLQQVENPIEWGLYYDKNEVDAAIDELKREHHKERHEYIDWVNRLQKEYAELKEVYKESVDVKVKIWERCKKAEDEIRRLKRALWIARAERAKARKNYWYVRSCHEGDKDLWSIDGSAVKYIGCIKRSNFDWLKIWSEVECKCRAKAKEYK